MEVSLIEALTVYGPLGLFAAVGCFAATKMFHVVQIERKERDLEFARLTTEHKTEMQAMVERYIRTTTSQVEQYHNLADKIGEVIASLSQRVRR